MAEVAASAPRMTVTQAHTAGVVVKPQVQSKMRWGLIALAMAVTFIPFAGPWIGHVIDRYKHGSEAKKQKKALLEWYRNEIAQQLGKLPSEVRLSDIEKARTNPTIRSLFDRVEKEHSNANRSSAIAATVATPLSAVGIGAGTKIATEIGLNIAANGAVSLLEKDRLLVDDVSNHINQKRLQQGTIEAQDALFMMLAHDPELQDQLAKTAGKPVHQLSQEKQLEVIGKLDGKYLGYAEELATQLNQGRMTEQAFTVAAGKNEYATYARSLASSWTARVGGSRAPQGSFRERVRAQAPTLGFSAPRG